MSTASPVAASQSESSAPVGSASSETHRGQSPNHGSDSHHANGSVGSGSGPRTAPPVTRDQAIGWYRTMLQIRRFEERSAMLYQQSKIKGFLHLYSGQEPVAVGSIGALRPDDYVITAYRDHGHALARGMSAKAGMAEMLGKSTGCARGKGGSMHFFDAANRFLGGHAIVGGHVPLALGVAWAIQYQNLDQVCICYFGDGAMNQGPVHEAFNMAAMWKCPAIFVVENNLYSMGTSLERSSCLTDLTIRGGTAYGIPGVKVNGNDVEEVYRVTWEAAARARAGEGPSFLDIMTYRHRGHSMSDPGKYRTPEELEEAKQRDPNIAYGLKLKERGWLDDAQIEALHEEVKREIDEAIAFAEESPEPPVGQLYEDITVAPFYPQESDRPVGFRPDQA